MILGITIISIAVAATMLSAALQWKQLLELREDMETRYDNLAGIVLKLRESVTALEQQKEQDGPELQRHGELLRQLNEEMERGLKMEKSWNDGLEGILNYSVKSAVGGKNE